MKKEYIDVTAYTGEGYRPVIDFEAWRVAILRYCEELEVQNLKTMQKHNESDEVFVLLNGNCTLFSGGQRDSINEIDAIVMEPLQLYNVKQGTWHTHTLDGDATVLIVENRNTSDLNSLTLPMTEQQVQELRGLYSSR
jgi:ureidoglycolate hydrolase